MSKRYLYMEQCRFLYIRGNTIEQISELTGVSPTTISKWKQEGDWERQRRDYNRQPMAMVEKINTMMEKLVDEIVSAGGEVNDGQADRLAKLAAVKKTLSGGEDLPGMVIFVTDKLAQFVRKRIKNENQVADIIGVLSDFLKETKEAAFG